MFPFGREPTPEELQEAQEAQRKAEIEAQEFRHSTQRLIQELDEDRLSTLRQMMHEGAGNPGLMVLWEGMIAMQLLNRFNICVTCNVNHELEFDMSEPMEPDANEASSSSRGAADSEKADSSLTFPHEFSESELDDMEKYHLDDAWDADTKAFLGFQCTGIAGMSGPCGVIYVSIEDRKLREAEHCSGCFVRMAQG